MPTFYTLLTLPIGTPLESTTSHLDHAHLTALLQRIAAPPELAALPFRAPHLQSTVSISRPLDADSRTTPPTATYAVCIRLSLPTPFGPFFFESQERSLPAPLISEFLTAQIYATLTYLSLFEIITTLCSQFGLPLKPYPNPLRPSATSLDCSWYVPGILHLDFQRYALSLHASFWHDKTYLDGFEIYPPTLELPTLIPTSSPSWSHFRTQVLPPFLTKISNHQQTAQLRMLSC